MAALRSNRSEPKWNGFDPTNYRPTCTLIITYVVNVTSVENSFRTDYVNCRTDFFLNCKYHRIQEVDFKKLKR